MELLAPAGDWESLRAGIEAKADAIYFGIKKLNMRVKTKNFEFSDIKKISTICHKNKIKCYLTLNTIIFDNELKDIDKIIKKAKESQIDAIICWDLAVISIAKKYKIPIHLSTQASVANSKSLELYKKLGIKRVILARELSLKQIKNIKTDLEIETFVHGAMCYAISGRCFFSQELYNESANRGKCIHPCRRSYKLIDLETQKEIQVKNNLFLSSKDLCTLPFLPLLINSNITSFKIEGRSKSPEYVYAVTKTYREAIDSYNNDPNEFKKELPRLMERLNSVYNRKFSQGFYLDMPNKDDITTYSGNASKTKKIEIGKVTNYFNKQTAAEIHLISKSLKLNDTILITGTTTGVLTQQVTSIQKNNKPITIAKKGEKIALLTDKKIRKGDKVFLLLNR